MMNVDVMNVGTTIVLGRIQICHQDIDGLNHNIVVTPNTVDITVNEDIENVVPVVNTLLKL